MHNFKMAAVVNGWEREVLDFFALDTLREHQKDTIQYLMDRKDVFLSVRTGGGKSLCYMAFPVASKAQHQSRQCGPTGDEFVLVVSPLVAIMTEQSEILNSLGLSSVCLGRDREKNSDILNGKCQFVFTSPESILNIDQFRGMLRSEVYKGRIGLIVIDEAHTVVQWGELGAESDTPFREWFGKLGELRSLLPSTPVLALTATASKKQRRKIQKLLGIQRCKDFIENPDRPNIKLHVKQVESSAPLTETFDWLLTILQQDSEKCQRVLIFCKSINDCTRLYFMCKASLCEKNMKHVDMFHSQTPEITKVRIREDMADINGKVRVLVCTTAAGMGVNHVGLDNVVNFGPPQEMDTLLQQQGRCGRTGKQAHHLLIYNNRQLRNIDIEVLNYVRNEDNQCRRQILLSHYSADCESDRTGHTCCDVCTVECTCDSPECGQCVHIAHTLNDEDSDSESQTDSGDAPEEVTVTAQQKHGLKLSLDQYRRQMNEDHKAESLTTEPEIVHGFTVKTIDAIINKCTAVHSADDVFAVCGLWTYEQARTVYVIICSVLEMDSDDVDSVVDDDYMGVDD